MVINSTINSLVEKEFKNKDGQTIKAVKEGDRELIQEFLTRLYKTYMLCFKGKNSKPKTYATKNFCERISKIDAIRLDDSDKNIMPLKIAFDDMKKTCHGKLEGGLFMPMEEDGVFLLDMDFMCLTKAEAIHTLIHEFIHALTMVEDVDENGNKYLKSGIRKKHDKVLRHLNEGITETIAQIFWMTMYKRVKCPGFGRYDLEVKAVRPIIEMIGEDEFIKMYLINPKLIEEKLQELTNDKGENLYEYILSFDDKDLKNIDVQKKYFSEIKNFQNNNLIMEI